MVNVLLNELPGQLNFYHLFRVDKICNIYHCVLEICAQFEDSTAKYISDRH